MRNTISCIINSIDKSYFYLTKLSNMPKYNHLIAANIASPQQSKALRSWIENCKFEKYESTEYELNYEIGRPKNKLYKFMLSDIDRQVVMKVVHINRHYEWKSRFTLLLKYHLRGTDRMVFRCCEKAYSRNLAVPEPLAYWKKSDSPTKFKSYFLYQHINVDFPWLNTYRKLRKVGNVDSNQKSDLITQKITDALKSFHRQGIRHGDVIPHNILMSVQDTDKLADAKIYFIDYDNASFTKIKYPNFIRRFFDLKDLWKMNIDDTSPYDVLKIYLGSDYHPWWNIVLIFWRWKKYKHLKMSFPDKLRKLKQRLLRL